MDNSVSSISTSTATSGQPANQEPNLSAADKMEVAQISLQKEQQKVKAQQEAEQEKRQDEDKTQIDDVVASLNQLLEVQDRDVKFVVDERDGQFFTSVLNRSTDELIREIPTEEYRQLEERLKKFQDAIGQTTGLFVDQLV
ncbi:MULTISPECIES: flagellar protein FlaG [unclassified Agarivorans]|uniref:flagellar protein FlaG n=1 Tax=unclassified Agarivorans TaxID=2636026 RepID=UPI0026E4780C|nr:MULTISPECIES: flagellar protein FlaG [unclassified Agarivorans]MDO6684700.1 flagellar protein FlaG [Agarivorans sp. 3_MG-2023]MDO6715139.1 flagellar protein FlaG [Agarivorans sp. 2_MG-2023]